MGNMIKRETKRDVSYQQNNQRPMFAMLKQNKRLKFKYNSNQYLITDIEWNKFQQEIQQKSAL